MLLPSPQLLQPPPLAGPDQETLKCMCDDLWLPWIGMDNGGEGWGVTGLRGDFP